MNSEPQAQSQDGDPLRAEEVFANATHGAQLRGPERVDGLLDSPLTGATIVILLFSLAGALIGGDIALWLMPEATLAATLQVASGLVVGAMVGFFIVWTIVSEGA